MSDSTSNNKSGRKIEAQYENPVDNLFVSISDKISPFFKRLNFTANGITTLSTIFWAGALYHLYYKDATQLTIYALLGYFFDVMDGHYARKYNMQSGGGDKYDHYKDILVTVIGIYILYTQYNITNFPILIVVLIALYFLSIVYLGCQEVLAAKENRSESLDITKQIGSTISNMDENTCKQRMKYLRWFGPGSMVIFLICSVLYINGDFNQAFSGFTSLFSSTETVVPGSEELFDKVESSSSDKTLPEVMSTFSPDPSVVDIRGFGPEIRSVFSGPNRADLEFLRDLRTFGSANLGTSTLGTSTLGTSTLDSYDPYSTNEMVDRLIRD